MELQRVGYDLATKQQQHMGKESFLKKEYIYMCVCVCVYQIQFAVHLKLIQHCKSTLLQ